jgi:MFS family permease
MDTRESDERAPAADTNPPYSIFSGHQKGFIVAIISIAATFSGFASNIYFPAIPTIANDLSVSTELIDLTITSYMIFQGISPGFWGAIADTKGRRITYICTFTVFLGACIGLAQTKNYAMLVALRCLQSTGSASTIAIGAGVLGDITTREERGGYMGYFQAGLLVPVALGPILGGAFSNTLGWRAIFWFLSIFGGIFLIALVLFLPETLRSKVGNGSLPIKDFAKYPLIWFQHRRGIITTSESRAIDSSTPSEPKKTPLNFLGSLQILFRREVFCIVIFVSIYYTGWQMSIAAMSTLFKNTYNLSDISIGLTFIANGVGCMAGTLFTGKLLDMDYRRIKHHTAATTVDFPIERARLRTLWFWSAMQCSSTLVFGWTLDKHVHISVPIISTFSIGWASISIQSVVTTFLVDIFPLKGASATAAVNLARCLMGAGGTASVMPLIGALSIGWTFTLLTGIMGLALALLVVQMKYGPGWRQRGEKDSHRAIDM